MKPSYKKFEKLLKINELTPYRIAKDLSINQSTLSQWKLGLCIPKLDKIKLIADYFGVTVDYFLE